MQKNSKPVPVCEKNLNENKQNNTRNEQFFAAGILFVAVKLLLRLKNVLFVDKPTQAGAPTRRSNATLALDCGA